MACRSTARRPISPGWLRRGTRWPSASRWRTLRSQRGLSSATSSASSLRAPCWKAVCWMRRATILSVRSARRGSKRASVLRTSPQGSCTPPPWKGRIWRNAWSMSSRAIHRGRFSSTRTLWNTKPCRPSSRNAFPPAWSFWRRRSMRRRRVNRLFWSNFKRRRWTHWVWSKARWWCGRLAPCCAI